jgi:uncharacterized RDD family membrane protein YckC
MAEQMSPNLAQTAQPAPGSVEAAEPSSSAYASIGDRLLAQALDLLLVAVLFYLVGLALAPRYGGVTSGGYGFNLEGWPALIIITLTTLPALAYFVLGEGLLGGTLGKVVAGIRVQRVTGGKIGLKSALFRTLLRIVDGAVFYVVGAIFVIVTKRHQRLGDLAAGSVVVRRETARWAMIAALIVILMLIAGGITGAVVMAKSAARGLTATTTLPTAPSTPSAGTGLGAGPASPAAPAGGPYPVPDMTGFNQSRSFKFDAVFLVPGQETTVDEFANAVGDKVLRFTTGTVVWAYGWVPQQGGTDAGYVIRDPSCSGAFTEKLASNVRLIAPDCAAATITGP